jgi:trimeric autotransporter adhesin
MLKVAGGGGVSGALVYQGTWDALTNNPTLTSGVGTKGYYYVVSIAGTTNLDGVTDWQVGDWAVFNGTVWQKVDNSEITYVSNVATGTGLTGGPITSTGTISISNTAVTAASYGAADTVGTFTVNAQGQLTAAANASIAINVGAVSGAVPNTVNVIAGTGLSGGGALTANVTLTNAGVTAFNTRTGNVTLSGTDVTTALGYTPGTGNGTVTSVTGTLPISSSGGTTPNISITLANATTDGYLSSTDWNTFNNKQPSGTYVNSVGATSPVASSGGTTPTISMAQANATTDGYLSSTDWTTFNNKGTGNGSVTSVDVLGGTTGLTTSGGPITGAGNITIAGTLVVSNGGTGVTSLTANAVVIGNATGAVTTVSPGALNNALISNGTNWVSQALPASGVTVTDDTSSNATRYITLTANTSGTITTVNVSSTKLTFNPSTGVLGASIHSSTNGIHINNLTIASSYTIPNGYGAMSTGPITLSSGVAVTVPSGSRWVVL